jgi:DDE family transposase
VVAAFDGGTVSSDAGALLLGRTDEAIGLIDRLAGCFIDERNPDLIEHTVRTLIGQRVGWHYRAFSSRSSPPRLAENVRAMDIELSPQDLEELDRVSNPGAPYPKWMVLQLEAEDPRPRLLEPNRPWPKDLRGTRWSSEP